jgi:hypothetical protein
MIRFLEKHSKEDEDVELNDEQISVFEE